MADIVVLGLALDSKQVLTARDRSVRALDQIDKSSKKTATGMQKLTKSFGRLAAGAAAFAAVALARKAFRDMAAAVADGEQSAAKLNSVLKATEFAAGRTAAAINKISKAMAETTLFNDDEIRDTAAVLLTFKNIQGQVFDDALASIADMASVLGTDLKSAAIQVGKALNDPVARLSDLARAGITFNEQQKEMVRTMTEAGNIAGAQGVIIKELASEFGGAAAGANVGLTGSIVTTGKEWDNFLEALGRTGPTQSALGGFFDFFSDRLAFLAFQLSDATEDAITKLIISIDKMEDELAKPRREFLGFQKVQKRREDERIRNLEIELAISRQTLRFLTASTEEEVKRARIVKTRNVAVSRGTATIAAQSIGGARVGGQDTLDRAGIRAQRLQNDLNVFMQSARDGADTAAAALERAAMVWEKTWGRAIENTQDSFGQFFGAFLRGEIESFKDFTNRLIQIWTDMLGQIAAAKLFETVLSTAAGVALTQGASPSAVSAALPNQSSSKLGVGTTVVSQTINIPVTTPDAASTARWLMDNNGAVAAALRRAAESAGGVDALLRA